ncbi:hypothetical protein KQ910_09660 [Reyranella sp. MMS21-HV4-11]|uniref:Uncharacterized protein n=1 Tax=Reyranella humidisoli TaxID=2849149 RepID=A0ABS6IHW9_9HYPH|nr:hypothetical protein [Reyranella sp. MMS21-HV4-11]MBU8874030.1 hypothetical protein [Reyranella sp. MMS21-HV4-11]
MGLYFNTKTTRTMQEKVNEQFTGAPIDFWKDFAQRKHFRRGAEGKPLHAIAAQVRLEPDDANAKKRWMQWLKDLERDTGDRMRDIFFENLDPSSKCKELNFVPVLSAGMPIAIRTEPPVSVPGGYALTVYIHTPTAKAVRAAIKKRQEAIARRRAKNKKD